MREVFAEPVLFSRARCKTRQDRFGFWIRTDLGWWYQIFFRNDEISDANSGIYYVQQNEIMGFFWVVHSFFPTSATFHKGNDSKIHMGFGSSFLRAIKQRHQDYKSPSMSTKHIFYTSWKKEKHAALSEETATSLWSQRIPKHLWPAGKLITSNLKSSKWFGGFYVRSFDQPQISIWGVEFYLNVTHLGCKEPWLTSSLVILRFQLHDTLGIGHPVFSGDTVYCKPPKFGETPQKTVWGWWFSESPFFRNVFVCIVGRGWWFIILEDMLKWIYITLKFTG